MVNDEDVLRGVADGQQTMAHQIRKCHPSDQSRDDDSCSLVLERVPKTRAWPRAPHAVPLSRRRGESRVGYANLSVIWGGRDVELEMCAFGYGAANHAERAASEAAGRRARAWLRHGCVSSRERFVSLETALFIPQDSE